MFQGIHHFAIASPNPKRLAEWYMTNLGFALSYENAGVYFVEAPNGNLIEIMPSEGERVEGSFRSPGIRHIAIGVTNFAEVYEQLAQGGTKFEGEPYSVSGNRLVFFKDPDGNLLHLLQRAEPLPVARNSGTAL